MPKPPSPLQGPYPVLQPISGLSTLACNNNLGEDIANALDDKQKQIYVTMPSKCQRQTAPNALRLVNIQRQVKVTVFWGM